MAEFVAGVVVTLVGLVGTVIVAVAWLLPAEMEDE